MLPVVWSQPNLLGFVEIDDIGISSKFCLNSDWHDDRVPYAWEQPNSFVCLLLQSFFWQCYIQNHLTMNRITVIQYLYSDCQYLNSDIYASCGLISTKSFGLCGDRWHRHFKQILFELWLAWRPGTICLRTAQLLCLPAFAVFLLTVLYSKPFDNEPYHRHSIFIFRLSIFIFRLSIFKQWYLCFLWSDLNQIFWALWRSMT